MVEVSRSEAVRSMISWCNVQLNGARTTRIIDNMVICRTFLRSVLLWVIDPQRRVTDRHIKYRPRIDRLEMCCLTAVLCPF
jgi:hypothetical protein